MEFHAIHGNRSTHVLTTHRGQADETPLQMVSAARLAYWQRLEAEHVARVAAGGQHQGQAREQLTEG